MRMFEEKRSRFVIGVMTIAAIVSISLLLQATGSALLYNIAMLVVFYTVLPVWICSYYFTKHGIPLRRVFFFKGTARWLLPIFAITVPMMVFSLSIFWLILRGLLSLSPVWVEF